jgi:hypothetical protein
MVIVIYRGAKLIFYLRPDSYRDTNYDFLLFFRFLLWKGGAFKMMTASSPAESAEASVYLPLATSPKFRGGAFFFTFGALITLPYQT